MKHGNRPRSSHNTASEDQSTQQLHNVKKSFTLEEQQFVQIADLKSLEEVLAQALNEAMDGRIIHATSQQTLGKVGKSTLTIANNFSSFLQAYSGTVEVMQGAGQQYGGIAYSALFLLLIVETCFEREIDMHRSP